MDKATSVLAVIPARGDSKGIPRKNACIMAGRPLILYIVETAQKSRLIDDVILSTDDEEIAQIAQSAGCEALERPKRLCRDDVPLDPVIHHAVSFLEARQGTSYDIVITLQPTCPLISPETLDTAIRKFRESGADTMLSAVDDRHLAWTKRGDRFVPLYEARLNRQYLPLRFRETGGFVIANRNCVTDETRFGQRIELFEVNAVEAVDVDSYLDWWIAEKLLAIDLNSGRGKALDFIIKEIKAQQGS